MARKFGLQSYIDRANIVHNNLYDYTKVAYTNSRAKIEIICTIHGSFTQEANSHIQGSGCPSCGRNKGGPTRMSQNEFVLKANDVHAHYYDYSKSIYTTAHTPLTIVCPIHGDFMQRPAKHILGKNGCPKCGTLRGAYKVRTTPLDFFTNASIIHNNTYDYSEAQYINVHDPIKILCKLHGPFFQSPTNHVHYPNQNKCPRCVITGYSRVAIEWIQYVELIDRISIQHALNGGEFKIPGTKYRADGYCVETNTIYEFYGDAYHGNMMIYKAGDTCHPFNKNISAGELYELTQTRETNIMGLGYNIVSMWEHDWNLIQRRGYYEKPEYDQPTNNNN